MEQIPFPPMIISDIICNTVSSETLAPSLRNPALPKLSILPGMPARAGVPAAVAAIPPRATLSTLEIASGIILPAVNGSACGLL